MQSLFLFFLCFIFSPPAKGFLKELNRPEGGPNNKDTILHKTIRAADRDSEGDRDRRLRKRVRTLLQEENPEIINVVNDEFETPLFLAQKYPLTTTLLLQKGADPNLVLPGAITVFQQVIAVNNDPSLLKIYLKWSRPNINVVYEDGLSFLFQEWKKHGLEGSYDYEGNLSLLQFLLYDVFFSKEFFEAQYERSREYNGGSLVAYALSLWQAQKKRDRFFANRYRRKEQILTLIDEGVDLTYRDPMGNLPLHRAIQFYDPKVAKRIIQTGGTLYLSHSDRESLVELATEKNYDEVIQLLKKPVFLRAPSLKERFLRACQTVWRAKL